MGDLQQGRIAIRPYDTRKEIHTMPMMFFVYLHVYLHVFTSIFANVLITHA